MVINPIVGRFIALIASTPSKIEWDLTNEPLSKLLEPLDTRVFSGSVQWVLLEISWKFCKSESWGFWGELDGGHPGCLA